MYILSYSQPSGIYIYIYICICICIYIVILTTSNRIPNKYSQQMCRHAFHTHNQQVCVCVCIYIYIYPPSYSQPAGSLCRIPRMYMYHIRTCHQPCMLCTYIQLPTCVIYQVHTHVSRTYICITYIHIFITTYIYVSHTYIYHYIHICISYIHTYHVATYVSRTHICITYIHMYNIHTYASFTYICMTYTCR